MSRMKDLSPAELEVMDALWEKGEATTKELQASIGEKRRLAYNTVGTLLTRLKDKGYVEASVVDFTYVYRPLVAREQVVTRKLDDLVARVLRGSLEPLANYIARDRNLTEEQMKVLEEILRSRTDKGEER